MNSRRMLRPCCSGISLRRCTPHIPSMKSAGSCARLHWITFTSIKSTNCILWDGDMDLSEYVPREELERRWIRVRRFMDCDSLVILQNVDQYYLTGTLQTGVLWFPREGEPLLAVRK